MKNFLFRSVEVNGPYLRFSRIAPADEGRYVCLASNMYGNTTKIAEVIVDRKLKRLEWFYELIY
jgi:Immunoglobulin I-set domain